MNHGQAFNICKVSNSTYKSYLSKVHITFAIKPSRWKIALLPKHRRSSKTLAWSIISTREESGVVLSEINANANSCSITLAGIQWASKSYRTARHSTNELTDLSFFILLANFNITTIQSGLITGVFSFNCISLLRLIDSNIKRASLILPFDSLAILSRITWSTILTFSSLATSFKVFVISFICGAGDLIIKQRDLIGEMIDDIESHSMIKRMFFEYFSMVRLSAACASLVNELASLIITHLNLLAIPELPSWKSTCSICATSFRSSWITTRSLLPMSLGVISKWYGELTTFSSSFLFEGVTNRLTSIFSLYTWLPKIDSNRAIHLVFLPDPLGPYISRCGRSLGFIAKEERNRVRSSL